MGFAIENKEDRQSFMFQGNATFTLRNKQTGKRYTYNIKLNKRSISIHDYRSRFYVSVLDENRIPMCIGSFYRRDVGYFMRKNRVKNLPAVVGFEWFSNNRHSTRVEFLTDGRCARCNRKLSDTSKTLGPECSKKETNYKGLYYDEYY